MEETRIDLLGQLLSELRGRFAELTAIAQTLESPNEEDTHDVKYAIVAFSLYTQTENWVREHCEFVRSRLSEAPDLLSARALLLKAMCLGGMCGLAFERRITEQEFQLMDLQLPGYLMMLGKEWPGS